MITNSFTVDSLLQLITQRCKHTGKRRQACTYRHSHIASYKMIEINKIRVRLKWQNDNMIYQHAYRCGSASSLVMLHKEHLS